MARLSHGKHAARGYGGETTASYEPGCRWPVAVRGSDRGGGGVHVL